jgi:hypothetical protein
MPGIGIGISPMFQNGAVLNYNDIIAKINSITGVTDTTYPAAISTLLVQQGGSAGTVPLTMLNELSVLLGGSTNYTTTKSAANGIALSVGGIGYWPTELEAWTEIEILLAPALLNDSYSIAYDPLLPGATTVNQVLYASQLNDRYSVLGKELKQTGDKVYKAVLTDLGLYFNGVNNFMKTDALSVTQPCDIYLLIKIVTWGQYKQFLAGNGATDAFITLRNATPNIWLNAGAVLENTHLPLNEFCIMRVHLEGASSSIQIDGTTIVTGNAGTYGFTAFALGASIAGSVPTNCEIRKVIFRTNGTDDATTKTAIYNHLVKVKNYNPRASKVKIYKTPTFEMYRERTQIIKKYTLNYVSGAYRVGFITDLTTFVYSDDSGVTYTESAANADWSPMANLYMHVTSKGTAVVIDSGKNKVWRSTNKGVSWTQIIVKDKNGADFTFHTPTNVLYPGAYFSPYYEIDEKVYEDNSTLSVWGNYGSANWYGLGTNPTNCFYTIDDFASIKQYYAFGQSLGYRDNGTVYGGITGTLLGDTDNPLACRHVHIIKYNQYNDSWYVFTGDTIYYDNICLKCNYNKDTDAWTVTTIFASNLGVQQIVDVHFDADGYMYFGTDSQFGIYKVLFDDIGDSTKYILLKDTTAPATPDLFYAIRKKGNVILAFSHAYGYVPTTANLYYSSDAGVTWSTVNVFDFMTVANIANKEDTNNICMLKNGWFLKLT